MGDVARSVPIGKMPFGGILGFGKVFGDNC
jgi:hypothetical protein